MKFESSALTVCILTLLGHSSSQTTESVPRSELVADDVWKGTPQHTAHSGAPMRDGQRTTARNSVEMTAGIEQYQDWWFVTTSRRPFISYRDYPGKPGIASWKEISANVAKDDESGKATDPTAAGVSSSAIQWLGTQFAIVLAIMTVARWQHPP